MPFTEIQTIPGLDFVPERLVKGDDNEFVAKMTSQQEKLESWSAVLMQAADDMNSLGRDFDEASAITREDLSGIRSVETYAEMKALDASLFVGAIVRDPLRGGEFVFLEGDYSAEIAADPLEGVTVDLGNGYVAVRKIYGGYVKPEWYHDGGADWAPAFNAASMNGEAPLGYKTANMGVSLEANKKYVLNDQWEWPDNFSVKGGSLETCEVAFEGAIPTPTIFCNALAKRCSAGGFSITHRDVGLGDGSDDGTIDMIDFRGGLNWCDIRLEFESNNVTRHGLTVYGEHPLTGIANNNAYNNNMYLIFRRAQTGNLAGGTALRGLGTANVNTRFNNNNIVIGVPSGWNSAYHIGGSGNRIVQTINPCPVSGATFQNDQINGCENNVVAGLFDSSWTAPTVVLNGTFDEYWNPVRFEKKIKDGTLLRQGVAGDKAGVTIIGIDAIVTPSYIGDSTTPDGGGRIEGPEDSLNTFAAGADLTGGSLIASPNSAPNSGAVRTGGAAACHAEDSSFRISKTSNGSSFESNIELSADGFVRFVPLDAQPSRVQGSLPIDGMLAVCDGVNWDVGGDGLEHLVVRLNGTWVVAG